MLPTTQQASIKAKQLRQSMTPAEALLWAKVRNNQLGVIFLPLQKEKSKQNDY